MTETTVSNFNFDAFNSRYENEARLRIEDVDALKKKFGAQIAQLQDQLDSVMNKMKALDQQKARLQTEVTVLIKDLEVISILIINKRYAMRCFLL